MRNRLRLLGPVVVAVTLGPLVAALFFCLLALYTTFFEQAPGEPLVDLLPMFGIYVAFAYFAGVPIALLAGLLVSIWMIWRPPSLVVAIAAALASVLAFRVAAEVEMLDLSSPGTVRNNFALTLLVAVIAASICWLLMRRLARTA